MSVYEFPIPDRCRRLQQQVAFLRAELAHADEVIADLERRLNRSESKLFLCSEALKSVIARRDAAARAGR